jgi:hypothetical protein
MSSKTPQPAVSAAVIQKTLFLIGFCWRIDTHAARTITGTMNKLRLHV